jgi:hypothetical protein
MPGCRRTLRWLGSQLLYRRSQGDCPEPMRTSQRNLHHQLLRSGVLITRSSHARMPVRDWHGRFVPEFIAGCCARAASGHPAAAPASSVMNSRRFILALIRSPHRRAAGMTWTTQRQITLTSPFQNAITTLTLGFPPSSVSSCTVTRITTLGFFARAFVHSRSIISAFSTSVSRRRMNILRDKSPCSRRAAEQGDEDAPL